MLSETVITHIKSKVCTSVSFESSFQVQPFGLHVSAKDNFIIVFAKISVALPIPLVAPVISAVLLMIYHFVIILLISCYFF
jgi:hypothetical protein